MCSAFLWKGNLESDHRAKVAWKTITKPKEEGGLGIKNLRFWNRTYSMKLLWMLFFQRDSVWVAWIHQNVIKDRNFWDLKRRNSQTWLFKQLLSLRHLASNWIRIIPGNGKHCSFWSTPWSPMGPLLHYFGNIGTSLSGIPLSTN